MNLTGWEQLLFVCAVTALLAPPLGRYLAATFSYLPGGRPPYPPMSARPGPIAKTGILSGPAARTRAAECLHLLRAVPRGTGSFFRWSG
jgi:hypothetical protein